MTVFSNETNISNGIIKAFKTAQRNNVFPIISNLTTESKRPEKTAYISRRYHQKMTSEKRAQKFRTTRDQQNASPHRSE